MGDYRIEVFLKTRERRSVDVAEIVKKRYRIPLSIDCPKCGKTLQLHESEDHYFHHDEVGCKKEVPVVDYVSEEFAKAELLDTVDAPDPDSFEEITVRRYVALSPAVIKVIEQTYMIAKRLHCYDCRRALELDREQLVWRHFDGRCPTVIPVQDLIISGLRDEIRDDIEVGQDKDDEVYNQHLLEESYEEDDDDEDQDEDGDQEEE